MFAALSRVFPPHPASGIVNAAASASPIISFLLFILPLLVPTASFREWPTKDRDDPRPAWVANREGNGRLPFEEDANAFLVAFDKANSGRDDLLATWRSRPAGGDGSTR